MEAGAVVAGQILVRNPGNTLWVPQDQTLNNLADTDVAAAAAGQILVRNAGNTAWEPQARTLDNLADTDVAAAAAGQILVRNAGNTTWEPQARTLDNLTDTDVSGATAGQVLTRNAGNTLWVPVSPPPPYTRTVVAAATYAADGTEDIIAVQYTPTGAVTVTLPQVSTLGAAAADRYRRIVVLDEGGNADVNNITIAAAGGDTILGQASIDLIGNYNSVSLVNNGASAWFVA